MVQFCSSCFHCENAMESSIVQVENEAPINCNSTANMTLQFQQHSIKMIGASSTRCLGSLIPIRSPRSFKNLCFLTAMLTFCVGIGIGVLIPLYLMPKAESLAIGSPFSSNSTRSVNQVHFDYVNSVNSLRREDANRRQASTTPSMFLNGISPNSDEDISSRFPEFAQIQALVQHETTNVNIHSDSNTRTKVIPSNYHAPSLFRPKPNVKFVDSRILSLHPVHQSQPQQIPAAAKVRHQDGQSVVSAVSSDTNRSHKPKQEALVHRASSELVEGIYWSDTVERQLPRGFTDANVTEWRNFVLRSAVDRIEEGCGRMQNRLLTLDGEVHACCRYRQNSDQIQGEIFSFYLSRLLGLQNLAPSTLALIQLADPKWMRVRQELNSAQWTEEKPVVLTQFIPNLSPAFIPAQLRDSKRSLHPIDIVLLSNSIDTSTATTSLDVKELAQWSDLIIFDYLTANLDRMVNNLYNLQWNPSMMDAPAHNLVKDSSTGLLVFLDNESGLLHGYRLLDKYEQYHRVMLESLCVFRKSTVNAIKRLKHDKNVGHLLKEMFHSSEPHLIDYLPMMPDKSIKILNHRIERVFDQIRKCESLYPL